MSRGLGKLQQGILMLLADNQRRCTLDIAVELYGIQPNEDGVYVYNGAQHTAVRRALLSLKKLGHIDSEGGWRYRQGKRRAHWWFIYEDGATCKWPKRSLDEIAADILALAKAEAAGAGLT
jgi:hypothetical protein